MKLFYVYGGGLGHLSRVHHFIQYQNWASEEILIVTPSHFTHYFPAYKFVKIHWRTPIKELILSLNKLLTNGDFEAIYIDTFPFGLYGELSELLAQFKKLSINYLARVLKWQTYLVESGSMDKKSTYSFENTYLLEPLYPKHQEWILAYSKSVFTLPNLYLYPKAVKLSEHTYWLLVHSGGIKDVETLVQIAIEERRKASADIPIYIFTQVNLHITAPNIIIKKNTYPVNQYFELAERIFTGAGFNIIQECERFRAKQYIHPFPKKYDDQFFRLSSLNR